ncbi:MAG TPA: hypothetical protein VMK66_08620 [Myxococcales bacterium]|nr:hypothetical protein [Myxococcales bacterium]
MLLVQQDVGPVADARIHFAFSSADPAGSRLDPEDVRTDADGVASARLIAGAPARLQIVASAPGAGEAAFTVDVIPLRRALQAIPAASTVVAPGGASASAVTGVSSSLSLRVREVDADTGEPISGDTIAFTLPDAASAHWSAGVGATALAQTGAGGQARASLLTGPAAEGPWQAIAQPAAGGPIVTFAVTVQGGGSCTANAQCPPGQICAGDPPGCQDAGGDPCTSCPPEDLCVGGVCVPGGGAACDPDAPRCAPGQCCDESALSCRDSCPQSCAPGTHCEAGDSCGDGACVPDETVPDVTGFWLTQHDFSIGEVLPLPVREIFKGLRLIDQTLLGTLRLPFLPRWVQDILDAFIARLLQQYLPLWLQQLIHVSDDLATVLSNLRAEGTLRLTRNGDAAHLKGEEVWTSLVFYWLPLCEGDIGGDLDQPPECARIDVLTTDSGPTDETAQCNGQLLPAIAAQVSPFTATVARQGTGYALQVDRRQVKLQMGKIVLILVDQLISLVSGGQYHCIDEATECRGGDCLVDCRGLGDDVDGATDGVVDSGTIDALCSGAVREWGKIWIEGLAQMWPATADTLDFSGRAGIYGSTDDSACDEGGAGGECAARMGKRSWDRDLNSGDPAIREGRDGSWSGDFFFQTVHKLPGAWRATRP